MRSDCSDVRFINSVFSEVFPHAIVEGCNTTNTSFYIKIPELIDGTTTVKMLYGSDDATDANDPNAVFEFYDDFNEDNINPAKWNTYVVSQGSVYQQSGKLFVKVDSSNDVATIKSIYVDNIPLIMETYATLPNTDTYQSYYSHVGFVPSGYTGVLKTGLRQARTSDSHDLLITYLDDAETWTWIDSPVGDISDWAHYTIQKQSDTDIATYRDGTFLGSKSGNTLSDTNIGFSEESQGNTAHVHIAVDWVLVRKYATTPPSVVGGSEVPGTFEIGASDLISNKALVYTTGAGNSANILSVKSRKSILENPRGIFSRIVGSTGVDDPALFSLSKSSISGGNSIRIFFQQPTRIGGLYLEEHSSYGNIKATFIYEDSSTSTINPHSVKSFDIHGSGGSADKVGAKTFFNEFPDKKVKDITFIFENASFGEPKNELISSIYILSAPVDTVSFLTMYPIISAYYGNSEVASPDYNPHTNFFTRAYTPYLKFDFNSGDTSSPIFQSFSGGLASAVSGGTLSTDLLTDDSKITHNVWNNKVYDNTHDFVEEYWRGITTSGASVFVKLNSISDSGDWGTGNHDCALGYPIKKTGTETFGGVTIANPYAVLSTGGTTYTMGDLYSWPYTVNAFIQSIGTSTYLNIGLGDEPFCYDSLLGGIGFIGIANENNAPFVIDNLRWYFTHPFQSWTVSENVEEAGISFSIQSVSALPTQPVSGQAVDISAFVVDDVGDPLSGVSCSIIYAGETKSMSEQSAGEYVGSVTAIYKIDDYVVSCSSGAESTTLGGTFNVTKSPSDYITITAFTDLSSRLLAVGDNFAPLAHVDTNDFSQLGCVWHRESSPSNTTSMIEYSGNPFNFGPIPGTGFDFSEKTYIKCCRGTFCESGVVNSKVINTVTPTDVETVYIGGYLPLGGYFKVASELTVSGTEFAQGGMHHFQKSLLLKMFQFKYLVQMFSLTLTTS